jgi:membrane-associated protein
VTHADKLQAISDIVSSRHVLAVNPLNPQSLLKSAGEWALWIVIFAETGLLIGFFLPGDTLLFLAGVASSQFAVSIAGTKLALTPLLVVTPLCAIAGAQLGHHLGARYGVRMFDRPKSRIFKREYVDKTDVYFEKFGPAKAIVLARFIPIVRTFLNPVAGVLGVPAGKFLVWNVVGAVIWTEGILLGGHVLAKQINDTIGPNNIDKVLVPIIIMLVLIAATPIIVDVIRKRRAKKAASLVGGGKPPTP